MTRCIWWTLWWLMIAHTCACAAKPQTPIPPTPSSHLEWLEQLPADGWVAASDVYDDGRESTHRCIVLDENGNQTSEIFVKRRATDRYGATVSDEAALESEFWRRDEQGNIVLLAHIDQQEKTVTHFRPPLIVMPPQLRSNDTFTSEAAMRIVNANNPMKVREQGQARRAVSYVGDQRLRTARGEFTARRLEIKFIADLRLAQAEERTIFYIVPGEGVVVRQTEVTVKILGALSKTKRHTYVRVD